MPVNPNKVEIGDTAIDFEADSTQGRIRFHEFIDGAWTLFTTHPTAFTAVCSTELVAEARRIPALRERGIRSITIAQGTPEENARWASELSEHSGVPIDYPVIADKDLSVGELYGLVRPFGFKGRPGLSRTAIIIDPQKQVRWVVTYPHGTGRNFDEVIRVFDSLFQFDKNGLRTPADWQPGEPLLVPSELSSEVLAVRYGQVDADLAYIPTTTQS